MQAKKLLACKDQITSKDLVIYCGKFLANTLEKKQILKVLPYRTVDDFLHKLRWVL